ncbi:hypothetical protein B296_00011439 [Ensete ventricosum]|uniref:Uncharacterized protein n=1 Tax=Ensete ventricosum TaxID=4639 RepID=A0A426YUX8_ENSVE|nr:hypothetical protein B296_00011439 [Ensete ventricosum]
MVLLYTADASDGFGWTHREADEDFLKLLNHLLSDEEDTCGRISSTSYRETFASTGSEWHEADHSATSRSCMAGHPETKKWKQNDAHALPWAFDSSGQAGRQLTALLLLRMD